MKKQNKHVKALNFSSLAVQLAAVKAAEIEKAQIAELLNPTDECYDCQLQTEISICLEIANARTQILSDSNFSLSEKEIDMLFAERDAYIVRACEAVMKLYETSEAH
jgi:hypothetical protein